MNNNPLRRLRILQTLSAISPNPMGEIALLQQCQADPELKPTIDLIRQSISYLASTGLVESISIQNNAWRAAKITDQGQQFLTGDSEALNVDVLHPSETVQLIQGNSKTSSLKLLPVQIKAWVDQELSRGIHSYSQLVNLLQNKGYEISRSAIGRYGKKFKQEQKELRQTIDMAKAFAEQIGDDGAAMNQTLTALAQQEMMAVMRNKKFDENIKLPDLIRSIASLNRSDINTKKYKIDERARIEEKARKLALEDAANAVQTAAQEKGLSAEDADFWRKKVLGA